MPESDFEIVVDCISKHPGLTGREIATQLRRSGHSRFTSKLANQTLYRLLTAELVSRDGSSEKPTWFPRGDWVGRSQEKNKVSPIKRPLDPTVSRIRKYQIASIEVRVIVDQEPSPNDPYMNPDWVGSHVIASVNANHPFWNIRLVSPEDIAIYCMISAIDAYVLWKIAQLHEPPDATELQTMRDYAIRFCTLIETQEISSD